MENVALTVSFWLLRNRNRWPRAKPAPASKWYRNVENSLPRHHPDVPGNCSRLRPPAGIYAERNISRDQPARNRYVHLPQMTTKNKTLLNFYYKKQKKH